MNEHKILECCVDSVESALAAKAGGADRLELTSNLIIGGTTPTLALFHGIRERTDIRIHAIIRPRFGDFLYSDYEADIICKEIAAFKKAGAEGVVIGSFNPDGTLNIPQMKRFIDAADGMYITLHRAFDMSRDLFESLEDAKKLGVNTILTSGGCASCLEGLDVIKKLSHAAGDGLEIMAGAGMNYDAAKVFLEKTGVKAFHMSGKSTIMSSMEYRNPKVNMGLPGFSEYELWQTDEKKVRAVRDLLDKQ